MNETLSGKIAIVTGGCSGLGAATVQLFLNQGARVVIADIQDEIGKEKANGTGGHARYVHCDVNCQDDIQAMIGVAVEQFGGLDILFNNAGALGSRAKIEAIKSEDWDRTMNLLLRSVMYGIKHAVPAMRRTGGGSIINTSSLAGLHPAMSDAGYSIAKAGVIQLTRVAALELAPDSIRVNAICPGAIPTQMMSNMFGLPEAAIQEIMPQIREAFSQAQPLKRCGTPEDIAQAALFLASDASSFITGQAIVVDGGLLLQSPDSLSQKNPKNIPHRVSEICDGARADLKLN